MTIIKYMFKVIILMVVGAILVSLASGMVFLTKSGTTGDKVLTSLKLRIGLSILLIVLIVFGFFMGWIEPNNVVNIKPK